MLRIKWLCILSCLLLAGCWDRRPLEELDLAYLVGFDKHPSNRLLVTTAYPTVEENLPQKSAVISTITDSFTTGQYNLERRHGKYGVSGQIQALLFSMELARDKVMPYLDSLQRDPVVPSTMTICIVSGSAKELITKGATFAKKGGIGFYVSDLIKIGDKRGLTFNQTLDNFWRNYYDEGIDNVIPLLGYSDKDLSIEGLSIFKDKEGKVVGSLTPKESLYFISLKNKLKQGILQFTVNIKERNSLATFSVIKATTDISVINNKGTVDANIKPSFELYLTEIKSDKTVIIEKELLEELEKQVTQQLNSNYEKLISKLQKQYKADVLGIGTYVRAYLPDCWKRNNWDKQYLNVNFKVTSKVSIRSTGLIR